eukprot:13211681-Heterocapsa_arctica.AAC.1
MDYFRSLPSATTAPLGRRCNAGRKCLSCRPEKQVKPSCAGGWHFGFLAHLDFSRSLGFPASSAVTL